MTSTDVVVDTDAVSFLFRGDSREKFYLPYILNRRCIISFMTVAELEFGILRANWGEARRNSLTDFVMSPPRASPAVQSSHHAPS